MNIRKGTKTAGVIKDLTVVPEQAILSLTRWGYGDTEYSKSGQSSTRRVLSQARRAGLVKKDRWGLWSLTAKGRKVAKNL